LSLLYNLFRNQRFFAFSPVRITRGHPYKLFVPSTDINTRKHFFCVRIIELWNGLIYATEEDFN